MNRKGFMTMGKTVAAAAILAAAGSSRSVSGALQQQHDNVVEALRMNKNKAEERGTPKYLGVTPYPNGRVQMEWEAYDKDGKPVARYSHWTNKEKVPKTS